MTDEELKIQVGHLVGMVKELREVYADRNRGLDQQIKGAREQTDKLMDLVQGKDGLLVQITRLNENVRQLNQHKDEKKSDTRYVIPVIISIISTLLAGIALFLN